jgi:hypothetical protein
MGHDTRRQSAAAITCLRGDTKSLFSDACLSKQHASLVEDIVDFHEEVDYRGTASGRVAEVNRPLLLFNAPHRRLGSGAFFHCHHVGRGPSLGVKRLLPALHCSSLAHSNIYQRVVSVFFFDIVGVSTGWIYPLRLSVRSGEMRRRGVVDSEQHFTI